MPDLSVPTLTVVPWRDPVIDALGYPPGSTYVERFWLAVLGPSTTWLVRHLDQRLAVEPDGATIELDATAAALGLGVGMGRHSPLVRALHRCCQFGVARAGPDAQLAVRRHLPPLTRHQVERLPPSIRARHQEWRATERDAGVLDPQQRRARHMALGLAELGEDVTTTAQRLIRFDVHPVVADDAAVWAHRLVRARSEAASGPARLADLAPAAAADLPAGALARPLPPAAASRPRLAPPIAVPGSTASPT
ncbi:MAG TPA: hypothetical protein VGO60_15935, partial [Iamia sp.]|nr:hypothetical protein [Iamia sp.]